MIRIFRALPVFLFFWISVLSAEKLHAQSSVTFQVFYDQLSPYGSWVNYQQYGYVWIPTEVGPGFRPYGSSGHWVLTDEGWTWISDYPWGWAPFHYGNWFYDDGYGWMWIPGYSWAPAWVTWGEYNGSYCWAPVGPNIEIGAAWGTYRPPVYYWTFLPGSYMGRTSVNRYYMHYNTSPRVVSRITVINNVYRGSGRPTYMRGPQPDAVERYTHSAIRPVPIQESAKPMREQVQNGHAVIYRPTVSQTAAGRPVAPSRVKTLQAVKPADLPGYNKQISHSPNPGPGHKPPVSSNPPNHPAPARHQSPRPVSQPEQVNRPVSPHPAPQTGHHGQPAHPPKAAQPYPARQHVPQPVHQERTAPAPSQRAPQPVHQERPPQQPPHQQAPPPARPQGEKR